MSSSRRRPSDLALQPRASQDGRPGGGLPHEGSSVHLLGIGGVAMSGLAAILQQRGMRVSGSDGEEVYPPVSERLALPIVPRLDHAAGNLPAACDEVVVGNVIHSRGSTAPCGMSSGRRRSSDPALQPHDPQGRMPATRPRALQDEQQHGQPGGEPPHEASSVHLLGIGGVAMSGLAAILQQRGLRVSGSDGGKVYPPVSERLALQIVPRLGYAAENLPAACDEVVVDDVIHSRGSTAPCRMSSGKRSPSDLAMQPRALQDEQQHGQPGGEPLPGGSSVHLLGIGGVAMSGLAAILQQRGMRVSGSDGEEVYPPVSERLRALQIVPRLGYAAENLPAACDEVVVGNVIRRDNPEAQEAERRGLPRRSMPEAVAHYLIGGREAIVVSGTHGKTTTTALIAHLLIALGLDPGVFIGGEPQGGLPSVQQGSGAYAVIEGDEYDSAYFDKTPKFFKYRPRYLVLTSLEYDHADIYPDVTVIEAQFRRLIEGLPADGLLLACVDDPRVRQLTSAAPCAVIRYGFGEEGSEPPPCRIVEWQPHATGARFALHWGGQQSFWETPLVGRHNARNAAAAIALLGRLGCDPQGVALALRGFAGVRRRQEAHGEAGGVQVIDDFAHHPTAVQRTIEALREHHPQRRLWAVFEPRSFTARGNTFQRAFVAALQTATHVLIAAPYVPDLSAGSTPPSLDTERLAAELRQRGVQALALPDTTTICAHLLKHTRPGDTVLIMSNGSFDDLHRRLLEGLTSSILA